MAVYVNKDNLAKGLGMVKDGNTGIKKAIISLQTIRCGTCPNIDKELTDTFQLLVPK